MGVGVPHGTSLLELRPTPAIQESTFPSAAAVPHGRRFARRAQLKIVHGEVVAFRQLLLAANMKTDGLALDRPPEVIAHAPPLVVGRGRSRIVIPGGPHRLVGTELDRRPAVGRTLQPEREQVGRARHAGNMRRDHQQPLANRNTAVSLALWRVVGHDDLAAAEAPAGRRLAAGFKVRFDWNPTG